MAHNLNTIDGNVAFASTEKAWHNLGMIVPRPMTTKEAIEYGRLDYTVLKEPLKCGDVVLPNHMATVRQDTRDIFGVVGNKYEVVQNTEAFDFFDSLLGADSAKIETVGALGSGEKIFVTCKLPHHIVVGSKEDLTEMYVLLTSSHDGSGAIVAGLTPIRVVCQNTLNFALNRKMSNRISIRHTSNAQHRLGQAGEIMRHALEYQISLEQAYNFLYKTPVSDVVARDLIKQIVQGEKTNNSRTNNILDTIEMVYNTGIGQEGIVGTAWGVFNGITNYLSHEKNYFSNESKFNSLLMGGESEKLTKTSFDVLMNYAKTY